MAPFSFNPFFLFLFLFRLLVFAIAVLYDSLVVFPRVSSPYPPLVLFLLLLACFLSTASLRLAFPFSIADATDKNFERPPLIQCCVA